MDGENKTLTIKLREDDLTIYRSCRRRFIHLDPPWKAYDIPRGSLGWRMGYGEDYMMGWHEFWGQLDTWEREQYFNHHIPPEEWKDWFEKV